MEGMTRALFDVLQTIMNCNMHLLFSQTGSMKTCCQIMHASVSCIQKGSFPFLVIVHVVTGLRV